MEAVGAKVCRACVVLCNRSVQPLRTRNICSFKVPDIQSFFPPTLLWKDNSQDCIHNYALASKFYFNFILNESTAVMGVQGKIIKGQQEMKIWQ